MKKTYYQWLMLLAILLVFATYWINRQYFSPNFEEVPPTNEAVTQPVSAPSENTNRELTFKGPDFTFKIPADLKEGDTNVIAKHPTGCGDAFQSAVSCTFFNPIKNPDNQFITATIFKSADSASSWCKKSDYTFKDCTSTTINGYPAVVTTSPAGETPLSEWVIVSNGKTVVLFSSFDSTLDSAFKTMTESIKFE